MATATATETTTTVNPADLTVEQLKQEVTREQELNTELTMAAEVPYREQANQLQQVCWIERKVNLRDKRVYGTTRDGSTPVIRFRTQYSRTDKEYNTRHYGAPKRMVAYGQDLVEPILAAIQGGNRLVKITAFEAPWSDNSNNSDWVVTKFEAVPRSTGSRQVPGDEDVPLQQEIPMMPEGAMEEAGEEKTPF